MTRGLAKLARASRSPIELKVLEALSSSAPPSSRLEATVRFQSAKDFLVMRADSHRVGHLTVCFSLVFWPISAMSSRWSAPGWWQLLPEAVIERAELEFDKFSVGSRRLADGLKNPQHLKFLSDWRGLYRHLITLAFTQHGPAQRGFAADDLNELSPADQLHAAPIRAEKKLLLLVGGIN